MNNNLNLPLGSVETKLDGESSFPMCSIYQTHLEYKNIHQKSD